MTTKFSAVVLAAGRSTRMGSDKALLSVEGRALWQRQCDVLREAGATEVLLSARTDQPWADDPVVVGCFDAIVRDAMPDCGPLAGIVAALERASGSHLAVLAIDLPAMDAAWFRHLATVAAEGRGEGDVGVVGRRAGYFEPLAALYPKAVYEAALAALTTGDYSLQRLIAGGVSRGLFREVEIDSATAGRFVNWNERR
jgi:molybdopterin-guanine dinucleotide biosynthesis protein A